MAVSIYLVYYPGGMSMPGRSYFSTSQYRYGFNGQEKTPEIFEGSTTAKFWEYDSRTGWRWNIDPKQKVEESPYLTFSGNPILLSDLLGDTPTDIIVQGKNNSSITIKTDLIDIKVSVASLGIGFGGNYTLAGDDILSATLDLVGIVDPTGVADALGATFSAKRGDWLSAGISALGIFPYVGDLAKVGKIKKDVEIIEEAIKVVNGNSKLSTKAQHVYEVFEVSTEAVVKTGLSGGKLVKEGTKLEKSARAAKSVNKFNKEGTGKYAQRIVEKIPAGAGARVKGLAAEAKNAKKLRAAGHLKDKTKHMVP